MCIRDRHNSYQDNGIKFFSRDGFKLGDDTEREIEQLTFTGRIDDIRPTASEVGKATRIDDAGGRYIEHLKRSFPNGMTLEGMKIVVDCAHGAAYKVGPWVFKELGAQTVDIGVEPNGRNINVGAGSLHPEVTAEVVKDRGADLGICLDGDGDRCLLVDEDGELVDGDHVLAICGRSWKEKDRLSNGTVVATVMSNFGLERSLAEVGVSVARTKVGDRHVVEKMRSGGHNIGGEQSGHVIFRSLATTGDGLLTGIHALMAAGRAGRTLGGRVADLVVRAPQVLHAVPVAADGVAVVAAVADEMAEAGAELGSAGRVLVRPSGTEPVVRVMVEAFDAAEAAAVADRLVDAVRRADRI